MEQQLSISESEWRVMKIVWSNSPQTLPEILDRLKETGWSKTTIQTYLARLVKKGALTTKRQGKGYLYYPAVSESECQLAESRSFCICYWRYILCFISFYQSHSALYAAAMVSALRYDPFLRSIPFTGGISHITRNTGMVKWILYCLLDMGVWVWYSFRL